jgi:AhpD family alkylhydroperoxidase
MYDMSHLKKLSTLGEHAPDAMKAFEALNASVFTDAALSKKTKELIAVGIAIAVQCPYCIEIHKANAVKAGATDGELSEASFVAMAIGAGAAATHSTHAL